MCEDYPCCGHGAEGCSPQWFDEPDAFDTSKYPHALCEHEYGICDVEPEDEDDPEWCDDHDGPVADCWTSAGHLPAYDRGDFGGEDAYLDSYMEDFMSSGAFGD